MITAIIAKAIADSVINGETPSQVPSLQRQGNSLLDQCNFNVSFASMSGMYTTYIPISNYSKVMIDNCVDTLETAGYAVDRSRERSYKEIMLLWD